MRALSRTVTIFSTHARVEYTNYFARLDVSKDILTLKKRSSRWHNNAKHNRTHPVNVSHEASEYGRSRMNATQRQQHQAQRHNKSTKNIDIYLVIDSKQPVSRSLLVWMRRNQPSICHVLSRTRVIDVAHHAHAGVRMRVQHIPALIATNRPNTIISSIDDIRRILTCIVGSQRTRRPTGGNNRPVLQGGVDSHPSFSAMPPAPSTQMAAPRPYAADRTFNSFEPLPEKMSARSSVGSPADSGSSWRERKIKGLESDLESLIAARKQVGGSHRRIG